jgi:hypothetical protein
VDNIFPLFFFLVVQSISNADRPDDHRHIDEKTKEIEKEYSV